jgi:hypothetical protein
MTWETLMRWLKWAAKEDFELPSTNRAGDATVHDDCVMSEGFDRSHTAQGPSDKMKLAHTLLLKCVVTALILSILSYFFITRVVLVSGILFP